MAEASDLAPAQPITHPELQQGNPASCSHPSRGCLCPAGKGTGAQRGWATPPRRAPPTPPLGEEARIPEHALLRRRRAAVWPHTRPSPFSLKSAFCNFFKRETPPSGEVHYLLLVRTDFYLGSSFVGGPCPQGAGKEEEEGCPGCSMEAGVEERLQRAQSARRLQARKPSLSHLDTLLSPPRPYSGRQSFWALNLMVWLA